MIAALLVLIAQVQAVEPTTIVHFIQPSDRLSTIAKLYKVSEQDLVDVNAELFAGNEDEITRGYFIKFLSLPLIIPSNATPPRSDPYAQDLSQLLDDDGTPLMEPAPAPTKGKADLDVKKSSPRGPAEPAAPSASVNRSVHLSSVFGHRWGRHHKGIDIPIDEGTPVAAARDGVVERTDFDAYGYGYYVIVKHGSRETRYAHLSRISVRVGDQVVGGSTILGLSGSTGHSTGPHLHYELRISGTAVDPVARDLPGLQMMLRGISAALGSNDLQSGRYKGQRSSSSTRQQSQPTQYFRTW